MQIASNSVTTAASGSNHESGNMVQQIHKAANLDALVENLDGYVWSVDTEMRYIILNSALLNLIKDVVNVDAKPGDKMLDILGMLDPSKTEEWKTIYQQAFEGTGRRFISQFLIHGQPTSFEISINPMRKGNVINGISCFARNVTELIDNSRKLQESEIRFRSLIENSTDIIAVVDGTGNIVYGSPSIEKHFGNNLVDLMGISAFSFIHPDDLAELAGIFIEILSQPGRSMPVKSRAYTKEGQLIWVEGIVTNLLETEGVNGIVCNFRDVTERVKAAEALHERELRFRLLIENSADFIMMANKQGRFIYGSPSVKRHLGYSEEEYLDKTVFTFIHPDSVSDAQKLLVDLSRHRGQPFTIYLKLIHKNGEEIWVEGIATNLLDTPGINALVGNFRDVSERKKAERLIQESEDLRHQLMEEKINRQKEIMRAAIDAQENERAHIGRELHDNVKQILSTAKVCLEYGRDNEPAQQHMIRRAEEMINTAIAELRELSKSLIQAYEREIGLQLSIENLVESIRLSNRFHITINFSLPDENRLDDKLKMTLFRIIQEQLNNILTHAEAENISITIQQSDDLLSLCVADDGKGFDVQQKRAGIGITNIINRAEIFNGHVDIDSAPGKGCRMLVNFKV